MYCSGYKKNIKWIMGGIRGIMINGRIFTPTKRNGIVLSEKEKNNCKHCIEYENKIKSNKS
jgi:hypothetical protein